MSEKDDEIHSRVRSTEPLTEKLSGLEKLLVKLELNKDHFHTKTGEYKKTLAETQQTLAKKKAKLDQQVKPDTNTVGIRKPDISGF